MLLKKYKKGGKAKKNLLNKAGSIPTFRRGFWGLSEGKTHREIALGAYKKQMEVAKWQKSKWQKPAPLIGRKFPTYTRKDLAIEVGVLGAATGIGLAIRGKRKKKKKA